MPEPPAAKPLRAQHRDWRGGGWLIALLIAALGFGIVVQVRQNADSDSLSGLRQDDLVSILDNQNNRAERLRQQIAELEATLRQLQDSDNRNAAAQQQAQAEADTLGILLGTLPATGPGVIVTITDPSGKLGAEDLLDVVEELRGAGAEAIQVGSVRVSTDTSFVDDGGTVTADRVPLRAPYRVLAIGDASTLDTALNIPGGVAAVIRASGGELSVADRKALAVGAVRPLPSTRYAQPSR